MHGFGARDDSTASRLVPSTNCSHPYPPDRGWTRDMSQKPRGQARDTPLRSACIFITEPATSDREKWCAINEPTTLFFLVYCFSEFATRGDNSAESAIGRSRKRKRNETEIVNAAGHRQR